MASPDDLNSRLMQLVSGSWVTQMIHVAAELGLADQLAAAGPDGLSAGALAERCGADADALFRLLRGLASLGLFAETTPRQFVLTPLAELLRSDHPHSHRQFARMLGGEHYEAWGDLLASVRSGNTAFAERFGEPVFPWYSRHPERSSIFDSAMTDLSRLDADALLASTDFSATRHLIDVGGGRGELLQRVLHQHSHLQGTLFDQPAVVAAVEPPPELASRLQISGGDFFTGVPAGADAYLLKHILHDWDDADCQTILGQIRRSMASGGKVLILEQVIPSGNDPSPAKLLDLNMLVMTGGRERSRSEYSQLLEQSGLQLQAVHTTAAAIDMIEATAAE